MASDAGDGSHSRQKGRKREKAAFLLRAGGDLLRRKKSHSRGPSDQAAIPSSDVDIGPHTSQQMTSVAALSLPDSRCRTAEGAGSQIKASNEDSRVSKPCEILHQQAFLKFQEQNPEGAKYLEQNIQTFNQVEQWHAELSGFMQNKLQEARDKKIKVQLGSGEPLIVSDFLEKSVGWIKKMVSVGDAAVQFDPVHAALPWAAFRFVLQSAISHKETQAIVWDGTAALCEDLSWINVQEQLYLEGDQKTQRLFREACLRFYVQVFEILSKYIRYYNSDAAKLVLKAPFMSESDFNTRRKDINQLKDQIRDYSDQIGREDQTQMTTSVQGILQKVQQLEEMPNAVQHIQEKMFKFIDQDEREKVLNWISQAPYFKHYSSVRGKALEGTGEWLLKRKDFVAWRKSSLSQVLRVHGGPGTGKSTLVSLVINSLRDAHKQKQAPEPVWFFCARSENEPERRDPTAILQCLLSQLSSSPSQEKLNAALIQRYHDKREKGQPELPEVIGLCKQIIEDRGPTFIIIDALDECDSDSRDVLLESLESILRESSQLVKIFLSSRHDRHQSIFRNFPDIRIDANSNSGDIKNYIVHKVDDMIDKKKILNGNVTAQLRSDIVNQLNERANGM